MNILKMVPSFPYNNSANVYENYCLEYCSFHVSIESMVDC